MPINGVAYTPEALWQSAREHRQAAASRRELMELRPSADLLTSVLHHYFKAANAQFLGDRLAERRANHA